MTYVLIFVGGVIGILGVGYGLDFIGKFIPLRIVDTVAIIALAFWFRWVLKDIIKEAVSEAIRANKD